MVIEGLRYGSNPLLEMRIQDITLELDLSRHDPNNPAFPPPSKNDVQQIVQTTDIPLTDRYGHLIAKI